LEEIQQVYSDLVDVMPPVIAPFLRIIIIFVLSALIIKIGNILIDRIFMLRVKGYKYNESKTKTLTSLLKSIIRYLTYFVAFINTLEIFGIDTTSILTAAGVGGLAVGFGAQSLVKDVISGFFIIFEDQYNVGDYIDILGTSGIVEEIGLRTTRLRAFSGELHIIPNGEITRVTNNSRGAMRARVDVKITYEEDIDKAISVLEDVCKDIKSRRDDIIDGPKVLGVTNLGPSEVVISIIGKTPPMKQWSLEREIRKAAKEKLAQEGIEVPYPKMVYINRNPKREEVDH
jgi:small-conductance mechanosensitive channel